MEEASGIAGATAVAERPDASAPSILTGRRRPRLWIQALLLLGIYALLMLVCDPRGTLGTDTGAKVATLEAMTDNSSVVPDVGYWAEAQDPKAELHPLLYTGRIGDHWVQVSTVPMMVAAYPLYALGGYRLALLIPMLGAMACALAARGLAKRLGARDPDVAFWLVGLASPVAIYALDLWEHAPGLALMLFGVNFMLDAGTESGRVRDALFAGLLFGAAASMRTEAFVFGAVAGGVAFASLFWTTRNWRAVLARGTAAVAGIVTMFIANSLLERALLGAPLRAGRAAGAAGSSGGEVGIRLREAVTTSFGTNVGGTAWDWFAGLCIVGFVLAARHGLRKGWAPRHLVEITGLLAVPIAIRILGGPAFTPGFLVAFPMAALAFVAGWRIPQARPVMVIALAALPVVWATDYIGGAGPQWGGRYILTSSILLGVVGLVAAMQYAPTLARATAVLCIAITALGVGYLSQRSHDVDQVGAKVAALDSDVVISRDGFFLRELGAYYDVDRPWLTAWNTDLLGKAVAVANERGAETMAVITPDAAARHEKIAGWREVKSTAWPVFFNRIYVSEYVRTG